VNVPPDTLWFISIKGDYMGRVDGSVFISEGSELPWWGGRTRRTPSGSARSSFVFLSCSVVCTRSVPMNIKLAVTCCLVGTVHYSHSGGCPGPKSGAPLESCLDIRELN
jgi:hypothetical protein